tara:strand:+ start:639 stop:1208 length:570 start_codon:yes stop_codon:yes gene_type:complete
VSTSDNFYLKRRSVLAKKMKNHPIKDDDLNIIINAGIRVPDHGALNPWKIKVIQGEKLKIIDEEIILSEFKKENPDSSKEIFETESSRLQRASVVLAVLSTPVDHPKIPKWEMILSSGAVCMNLLSCAQSLGYAAQWLTEWYAYNDKMLEFLGGKKETDKISGFIYIGHKAEEPNERRRPDAKAVINFI